MQSQLALRIAGLARGEALPCKIRQSTERVSDADVAFIVHRDAGHPSKQAFRRIRPLLVQRWIALFVEAELVPTDSATTGLSSNRVRGDDRLVSTDSAVDESLHDLVGLHIEAALGSGLRDAARQLPIAQVVVWRNTDLARTIGFSIRRTVPIDVNLPEVDAIVIEDLFELCAPCRHHDVWCPRRRQFLAINVGVVEKIHAIDDDALLG